MMIEGQKNLEKLYNLEIIERINRLERYMEILLKHYPNQEYVGFGRCFGPDIHHCLKNMDDAINLLRTAGFSRDEAEIQFIESVNDYSRSTYMQSMGPEV